MPLPGLRPGVVMVGEGDEAELRDLQLGQVVKLGEVASVIVALLDGTRDAEALLADAAHALGEELNPMGLVELLQALDRRALLDTPRARMVVAQGLVRADIAALQRLARRTRPIVDFDVEDDDVVEIGTPRMAPGSRFECHSCNRCCSEQHLLGPIPREERDAILGAFSDLGDVAGSDPSNFIPLPTGASEPVYLLRPRDGHCSYLDREDGLCTVHKVLGEDVKPSVCRMFPYRAVRTPDGWDVGMSLGCPTVATGAGPDPLEDAERVLTALRERSQALHQVPSRVPLVSGVLADWSEWSDWETSTGARFEDGEPAEAWMASLRAFSELAEGEHTPHPLDETQAVEPAADDGDSEFVPLGGLGDAGEAELEAADLLLKDLSFWAELLVGLEAADPMSLRRFRSGVLRLRHALGHRPDDAPVLAEQARLEARREEFGTESAWATQDTDAHSILDRPRPMMPRPGPAPDVQRRFVMQELFAKRPFEYGTLGRGLVSLTLFLALLRLEAVPGDELHPTVADLSYLVHHPQLTDIIDTRATVRRWDGALGLHAALLGQTEA